MIQTTKEHIEEYLEDAKLLIRQGKYSIELGKKREKNRDLFFEYVLDAEKSKEILLSLTAEDFSEIVQNVHPKYSYERLYIFGKDVELIQRFGKHKVTVQLYIKFNKIDQRYMIVISFHEQEHKLTYPFRT